MQLTSRSTDKDSSIARVVMRKMHRSTISAQHEHE